MTWRTTLDDTGVAMHTWAGDAPAGAPRLLLLHGLTDSGPSWADAARRWGSTYRVLAWDAPGHGRSRRFTPAELQDDPIEVMYADIARLAARMVAEDGTPLVVVGHSMGGGLAAALAAREPGLVAAAVLEDPAWRPDRHDPAGALGRVMGTVQARESVADLVARGRERSPGWPESELLPWAQAKADGDVEFLRGGRAALPQPWTEIAAAITVPTLVVTGSDGVILGEERLAEVAALDNPALTVEVVPGADHCVRRSRTEAFHAVVDPWLAAHAPTR
ncbi:alpha/beta fold hydrolase [Arsenicicoccus dermatophilus]|uniref:alpha/beta fold hydrolase n=1 Tax=Arsenicicoccus dermatophilus TaxID=1076331 RepID=UPI001F4CBBF6|nr:alpha/beta hydrolase [Arsenicicoccus dermatophilus]MCH8614198.1 alpha/beta hydrolase [Arsenicicoccus dermatophilus]